LIRSLDFNNFSFPPMYRPTKKQQPGFHVILPPSPCLAAL